MFSRHSAFNSSTKSIIKFENKNKKLASKYEKIVIRSIRKACKNRLFSVRVEIPNECYKHIVKQLEINHFDCQVAIFHYTGIITLIISWS